MSSGAVIFDLDGVLIDSEALQYKAYSRVLARYGVRVSIEEYAAYWITAGNGPEHAVDTYALPLSPGELRALKSAVYHDILRDEVTLMPGALDALTRLHPHFPLAVATNSSRRDVAFVMEHFGVGQFFAALVTREDYAAAKPQPDAFLAAADRLGVAARVCLVVEDAHRGILAAHRAGATVVAVPNSFTRDNDFSLAAAVLPSLDELTVARVEQLLAGTS